MESTTLSLTVSEIFYSLQGEGGRAGSASIFIRLTGCSTKYACLAGGVQCDTEFESGREMTCDEILEWCQAYARDCSWIVWTGGEPADQITEEIVRFFKEHGYQQAIETSGIKPLPDGLDWITVSPKIAEHVVARNFPAGVTELRYVRHIGQSIPEPRVQAEHYFISPHADGFLLNTANVRHCVRLVKENPRWRLSLQMHKVWGIL